jgi:hypothetical protein
LIIAIWKVTARSYALQSGMSINKVDFQSTNHDWYALSKAKYSSGESIGSRAQISHANKEGSMEHDGHGGNVIFSILGPDNK